MPVVDRCWRCRSCRAVPVRGPPGADEVPVGTAALRLPSSGDLASSRGQPGTALALNTVAACLYIITHYTEIYSTVMVKKTYWPTHLHTRRSCAQCVPSREWARGHALARLIGHYPIKSQRTKSLAEKCARSAHAPVCAVCTSVYLTVFWH